MSRFRILTDAFGDSLYFGGTLDHSPVWVKKELGYLFADEETAVTVAMLCHEATLEPEAATDQVPRSINGRKSPVNALRLCKTS